MDENEIRASIQRKRDRISGYQSDIDKLKAKIANLEDTHGEVTSIQKDFEQTQEARRSSLSSVENCFVNPKIESTYASGMKSFLIGNEYNNAYDGLDEAKRIINSKIADYENEIDWYKSQISACNSEIEYLKSLLV